MVSGSPSGSVALATSVMVWDGVAFGGEAVRVTFGQLLVGGGGGGWTVRPRQGSAAILLMIFSTVGSWFPGAPPDRPG
ncbi:MAG: hypothetical protein HN366_24020 [Deltaproteobacteria bacterium]|nr:hypothetical protein [Deltaproteobacteria bacterium]